MGGTVTLKELCHLLQVSRSTIDRWRKEGMPWLSSNREVVFDKLEILKWLKENKDIKNLDNLFSNVNEEIKKIAVFNLNEVQVINELVEMVLNQDVMPEKKEILKSILYKIKI